MDYAALVADRRAYRQYLDEQIEQHPELFSVVIQQGYRFHGLVRSLRQQLEDPSDLSTPAAMQPISCALISSPRI